MSQATEFWADLLKVRSKEQMCCDGHSTAAEHRAHSVDGRCCTDDPPSVEDEPVSKHLRGQHDQRRHGHRALGNASVALAEEQARVGALPEEQYKAEVNQRDDERHSATDRAMKTLNEWGIQVNGVVEARRTDEIAETLRDLLTDYPEVARSLHTVNLSGRERMYAEYDGAGSITFHRPVLLDYSATGTPLDAELLEKNYENDKTTGFHPPSDASPLRDITTHEFAHAVWRYLDGYLGGTTSGPGYSVVNPWGTEQVMHNMVGVVQSLVYAIPDYSRMREGVRYGPGEAGLPGVKYREPSRLISMNDETEAIRRNISGYSTTRVSELFAEAFTEYRNSNSPRPLALAVGRLVDDLYARASGQPVRFRKHKTRTHRTPADEASHAGGGGQVAVLDDPLTALVDRFGLTDDPLRGAWLTPEGKYVDLGRNVVARWQDETAHWESLNAVGIDTDDPEAIRDFMTTTGAIRYTAFHFGGTQRPAQLYVQLAEGQTFTDRQLRALLRVAEASIDHWPSVEFSIDVGKETILGGVSGLISTGLDVRRLLEQVGAIGVRKSFWAGMFKHLQGQHEQKRHGHRGGKAAATATATATAAEPTPQALFDKVRDAFPVEASDIVPGQSFSWMLGPDGSFAGLAGFAQHWPMIEGAHGVGSYYEYDFMKQAETIRMSHTSGTTLNITITAAPNRAQVRALSRLANSGDWEVFIIEDYSTQRASEMGDRWGPGTADRPLNSGSLRQLLKGWYGMEVIMKHLQGRHDQKRHGRRGGRTTNPPVELADKLLGITDLESAHAVGYELFRNRLDGDDLRIDWQAHLDNYEPGLGPSPDMLAIKHIYAGLNVMVDAYPEVGQRIDMLGTNWMQLGTTTIATSWPDTETSQTLAQANNIPPSLLEGLGEQGSIVYAPEFVGEGFQLRLALGVSEKDFAAAPGLRGITMHEFAHHVHFLMTADAKTHGRDPSDWWKDVNQLLEAEFPASDLTSYDFVTKNLSRYGTSNGQEFFAEALAEYHASAAPRRIAQIVGAYTQEWMTSYRARNAPSPYVQGTLFKGRSVDALAEEIAALVVKHLGPGPHSTGTTQEAHAGHRGGSAATRDPLADWATGYGTLAPFTLDAERPFSAQWNDEVNAERASYLGKQIGVEAARVFDHLLANRLDALGRAASTMPGDEWSMMEDWYRERHDAAHAEAGRLDIAVETLVGITAALSAQGAWDFYDADWNRRGGNFDDAIKIVEFLKEDPEADAESVKGFFDQRGDSLRSGSLPILRKVVAMFNGTHPSDALGAGSKTRNFYNNIMFPDTFSGVTVDRWDVRNALADPKMGKDAIEDALLGTVAVGVRGVGANRQYTYALFADSLVAATREWNRRNPGRQLLPHQVQAILWWQTKIDANSRDVRAYRRAKARLS